MDLLKLLEKSGEFIDKKGKREVGWFLLLSRDPEGTLWGANVKDAKHLVAVLRKCIAEIEQQSAAPKK